ncbi:Hypothetical protein PHPALM_10410 [Phytophthora palmivora]|uniref:Uncharacterized protein n=1 Tax=Phytophthora palmivora TaxID=4796 RepID=A0A2P4Y4T9_9STRA|nr:Hypothetical protein PHPALM_10410 [Phytophthora palmivora]
MNAAESLHPVVVNLRFHRHHHRCFRVLTDRDQLTVMSLILPRLMAAVVALAVMNDATTHAMIETIKATAVTVTVEKNDKQHRSKNDDDSEPQQKEMKNGGARMARDELFAGMDDLTVDYEEDDE